MAAAAGSLSSIRPPSTTVSIRRTSSSLPFTSLPATRLHSRPRRRLVCVAQAMDLLGDLGARDPYPAEVESNFGEKVLGFQSTEHKILIPNLAALSLAQLSCDPAAAPLPLDEARKLLKKVVGWRLLGEESPARLQCNWKVRDAECGKELINRISKVAEKAGHAPSLQLEESNQVIAELWTHSAGGLSMNDFIVAAKIDEINIMDLVPKKRIWA